MREVHHLTAISARIQFGNGKLDRPTWALSSDRPQCHRKEIGKDDAVKYFSEKGDEYKLDLLTNLKDGEITSYTQGGFTDLCRGPHAPSTTTVGAGGDPFVGMSAAAEG